MICASSTPAGGDRFVKVPLRSLQSGQPAESTHGDGAVADGSTDSDGLCRCLARRHKVTTSSERDARQHRGNATDHQITFGEVFQSFTCEFCARDMFPRDCSWAGWLSTALLTSCSEQRALERL